MDIGCSLTQFRIETTAQNIVHLIFDLPGRSMNVFSNAAIKDLAAFAAWLRGSDARGVVVRSGKASAFCAGADLIELGQAYDMIMAAEPPDRFDVAFNHFFPLSAAIRALETSGKPVACVISGLALGGGCELAMGTHYRVLADTSKVGLGLPESLVGLLPGGGGTQRLPRLIGVPEALAVLLEGKRLTGAEALALGLADALVPPGEEIAAAERWILSEPVSVQPWDRADWQAPDVALLAEQVNAARTAVIAQTLGHYPAPLAILDCIQRGYPQTLDAAIQTEMEIFAGLIQRPEPRDMIRTMFIAKTEYDRRLKAASVPPAVLHVVQELGALWQTQDAELKASLAMAGFAVVGAQTKPDPDFNGGGYWIASEPDRTEKAMVRTMLDRIAKAAAARLATLDAEGQRIADYALVTQAGFPAYLGGPFSLAIQAEH